MPEDVIELKCPISSCPFYIRISKKTEWKKVHNAVCDHLLDQHPPRRLVETIYEFIAAEVRAKYPSFFGVKNARTNT